MYLLGVPRTHSRLDFPEAIADEQGPVNKHTIGRAIDLEVAEQDIGTEEGDDLVNTIVGLAVGSDIHIRGIGGKGWQGVCGAASTSAQGQDREVPYTQVSQFEAFGVDRMSAAVGGAPYLSRGHRGPPGRWNDMPGRVQYVDTARSKRSTYRHC